MSEGSLEESTRSLALAFDEADQGLAQALFQVMTLLLLDGEPVSPERLAGRLEVSRDEALDIMNRLGSVGGEFDKDENMVGFGLTLVPTPHRYKVGGRTYYVWCADEAIIFPALFQHTASIKTPDPISGEMIQLIVSPEGVEQLEPPTAVVSRRIDGVRIDDVRGTSCHYGHVFATRDSAKQYLSRSEGIELELVTVGRVFEIGQFLLRRNPLLKSISRTSGEATA